MALNQSIRGSRRKMPVRDAFLPMACRADAGALRRSDPGQVAGGWRSVEPAVQTIQLRARGKESALRSTVLYIDDVPELPPRASAVLENVDFTLVHVRDPREAADRLRREPPALVLIEVLREDCDGFELIEQILSAPDTARIPVVVLTRGERSPELYGRALELGVREFLCKPVLEAQVLSAVLEFGQQAPAAEKSPRKAEPVDAPESGDLATRPVPELFARLHRIGATGTLRLTQGEATRAVQFRNGSPVAVRAPRPRETFEEYALRTGWIKQEQYETAIEHQLGGLCDPRAALEAMEALSASQAEQVAQEQAREALLALFHWDAGGYEFQPKERIAAGECLSLDWDPAVALLEGVRRACPAGVVRAALAARSTSCAFAGPDLGSTLELVEAPPEQHAKLAALAGERTLAEEIAAAKLDPRLLYGLVLLGAVELDAPVLELTEALEVEAVPAVAAPDARAPAPAAPAPRPVPAVPAPSVGEVSAWLEALWERAKSQDDFELFGIEAETRDADVQRAYRELIGSFPPIPPDLDELAGRVRSRIDRAYGRVKSKELRAAFASLRKSSAKRQPAERKGSRAVEAEQHFRKGLERLAANDPVGGVEAFGMAVHLDPDQGDYVAHLGYALYRSKPESDVIRREALEHIAKGVKLAPDQVTPLLFLGRVFRETGAPASAAKVFRKALALSPDHHEVLQELCLVQIDPRQRKKKGLLDRLRGD
jgi:CheY-like chemotaxis protein/tetratricopeptide (TPR) repeat protein